MRRRFRFVRVLKWAGTLTCLLILAAFITSVFYHAQWRSQGTELTITLGSGKLTVYFTRPEYVGRTSAVPGWCASSYGGETMPLRYCFGWIELNEDTTTRWFGVPLWLSLLIALAPTLLLWRLDRRVPPGHCRKCRYNLTGNTTGRCPECGAAFAPAAR